MKNKIIIIGGGLAGLSAACHLGKRGYKVCLFEKNSSMGGRARQMQAEGFKFDMGPSWYWMPDVFESFYKQFNHSASDFYELKRLSPSYRVVFGKDDFMDMPSSLDELYALFEFVEKGAAEKLKIFLQDAEYKYNVGMKKFVFKPGLSIMEFADFGLLRDAFRLNLFQSMSSHIRKYFSNPRLAQIMEFPVLFLGAKPQKTPAMYSLMNYADMSLGTWYPMGGMVKIIDAMESIARQVGVEINLNERVEKIIVNNGKAAGIISNEKNYSAGVVVGSADYHHVEQSLLPERNRTYSKKYWDSRQLSPSCLLFYLGVNKRIKNLRHHTLFFDADFDKHQREIYDQPLWPTEPLFYVCCPSKTDPEVAPDGMENLFVLIPVAVALDDAEPTREKYFDMVINRLENFTGEKIREHIIFKKSYAHPDFITDYNALKGNAFGLANTLGQTAIFKPSMKSAKVENLFFAGQLTTPGPGMPPSIISGQVVAKLVNDTLRNLRD